MDPIWRTLPNELTYRICNLLTKVRALPEDLAEEIRSTGYLYHTRELYNFYFGLAGPSMLDLNIVYTLNDFQPFSARILKRVYQNQLRMWLLLSVQERTDILLDVLSLGTDI
jgi:hypothetical protein